jgi:hypothetical protein
MLKKIIVFSLIFCVFHPVYSQDCFDKLSKQAVLIDSLQKAVKAEKNNTQQYLLIGQTNNLAFRDTIKMLKDELSTLKIFKAEKKNIENQLNQMSETVVSLKNQIAEKNQKISAERLACEQKSLAEKEKGKNEALAEVINSYKNNKFDDLILSSTKLSVQRDMQIVDNNAEVKPILSDLEKYFLAKELLSQKIVASQINDAQTKLAQIQIQSPMRDKLLENIKLYKDFNDELKKTLEKLVDLDKRKVAAGEPEIQTLKFNEIISELADYMYNYYDFGNYPYLSNIILEIIKRKKPNADEDITDLLRQLQ